MRDRLIELLGDFPVWHRTLKETWMPEAVERLANYLLAEGVIVLPCKVGDVVHAKERWWLDRDEVVDYQITNIAITQNKAGEWKKKYRAMRFFGGKTYDSQLNFSFDDIGKTVFLTREEAERALAERRDG